MGRYYWDKKQEADSLKKVQIWWLKKYGYLDGGMRSGGIKWTNSWSDKESSIGFLVNIGDGERYISFSYTQTATDGTKKDFSYKIPLTATSCYFGNKRYWFICSLSVNGRYCGRRVGVLYKGGDYFGCRHCYNLTYDSRNKSRNSSFYPAMAMLDGFDKIEKLENEIKRRYYAGRPTKKQQRLDRLQDRMMRYDWALKQSGLL